MAVADIFVVSHQFCADYKAGLEINSRKLKSMSRYKMNTVTVWQLGSVILLLCDEMASSSLRPVFLGTTESLFGTNRDLLGTPSG